MLRLKKNPRAPATQANCFLKSNTVFEREHDTASGWLSKQSRGSGLKIFQFLVNFQQSRLKQLENIL